jgi:hypothetical protein
MEEIAPQSEAIYAEITRRFGAERLQQLQDMLRDLEREMTAFGPIDPDSHGDSA